MNHYRYATGYTDPTGLIKMGARYYNPTTGHFTQPDPSGQEANRYAYASNNPTTHNDPTGLCGEWYSLVGCDQLLEDQSSERSCLFWGVAGGAGAVVPAVIAGGPRSWAAAGSLVLQL